MGDITEHRTAINQESLKYPIASLLKGLSLPVELKRVSDHAASDAESGDERIGDRSG
jgi:hypothetical protein